jgi:hypothetical protein
MFVCVCVCFWLLFIQTYANFKLNYDMAWKFLNNGKNIVTLVCAYL